LRHSIRTARAQGRARPPRFSRKITVGGRGGRIIWRNAHRGCAIVGPSVGQPHRFRQYARSRRLGARRLTGVREFEGFRSRSISRQGHRPPRVTLAMESLGSSRALRSGRPIMSAHGKAAERPVQVSQQWRGAALGQLPRFRFRQFNFPAVDNPPRAGRISRGCRLPKTHGKLFRAPGGYPIHPNCSDRLPGAGVKAGRGPFFRPLHRFGTNAQQSSGRHAVMGSALAGCSAGGNSGGVWERFFVKSFDAKKLLV